MGRLGGTGGAGGSRSAACGRCGNTTGGHAIGCPEVEAFRRRWAERREAERVPVVGEADCGSFSGRVTDLSPAGVFIDTICLLEVGTPVGLTLRLPGLGRPLQAQGQVAWVQPYVGIGVQFTRLEPAARRALLSYLLDQAAGRRPTGEGGA